MVQACSLHAASGSVQPSYHVPSALRRSTSHHKLRDTQRGAPLGPAQQQARFLGTVCVRIRSPGQLAQCWFSAELNPCGASQHTWHCAWIRGWFLPPERQPWTSASSSAAAAARVSLRLAGFLGSAFQSSIKASFKAQL